MKPSHPPLVVVLIALSYAVVAAQTLADNSQPLAFEVVSIKRVAELRQGSISRTLPDGTFRMTNGELGPLINLASPVPLSFRDVVGMPDWMMRERYDVTAKPPSGLTVEELRAQTPAMWRAMFADRMKLVAHVEQRERDVYLLQLARRDGKLGPGLKASPLDCTPHPVVSEPPPQTFPSLQERQNRCGLSMSPGLVVSGGVTMDRFVPSLRGFAGGDVENHTGLAGQYALTLRFSPARQLGAENGPTVDDAPGFFTALQEQLGLKLVHSKNMMPVFVIDHVEKPTPD
jgi:uncharacterized protein (TIGR03435 family)